MTRKEAVEILKSIGDGSDDYNPTDQERRFTEAYNMAVRALEQQPNWITNDKGEKIAFDNVPIEKVNYLLEIFESEESQRIPSDVSDIMAIDRKAMAEIQETLKQKELLEKIKNQPLTVIPKEQPCEDAVSREEIMKQYEGSEFEHCNFVSKNSLLDFIEKLPPVTTIRPKGEWIEQEKGMKVTTYKCSRCGRLVSNDTGYDVTKDYPFCHCGADMREVKDIGKDKD